MGGGSKRRSREYELIMCGDVLFEVLVRLPFQVLFRFKVVSKQWLCMISDPSFARRYVARASLSPQHWIFISCFARQPILGQFFRKRRDCWSSGINCLDLLTFPQSTNAYELRYLLVGISNGLLLFGPAMENHSRGPIYSYDVYNPMTGQGITLPPVPRHRFQFQIFTGFVTRIKDNVLESFRVLRIVAGYKSSHTSFRYEVYFSEIREWVWYVVDFDRDICFDAWDNCVVSARGYVMAFDLYYKPDSIRLIPLPVNISNTSLHEHENREHILLDERGGHLRYAQILLRGGSDHEFSLCLWELMDYDSGEWCLQHRVVLDKFGCDGGRDGNMFVRPLCFDPFGSNILYMLYKERPSQYLITYDMSTRELEAVDETMDDSSKKVLSRIPFLLQLFLFVVPPWPVLVDHVALSDGIPPETN